MILKINFLKQLILITVITVIFYLILDVIFGQKIIHLIQKKNNITLDEQSKPTIKNKDFKYNFKKNLKQTVQYGIYNYQLCTNKINLRIDCKDIGKKIQDYEILFIGDSFTEGVGLPYEETFVGIFEKRTNFKIANLAVSGYSPFSYYNKILSYQKKINFQKIKEVIVFIDISDNRDDLFLKRNEINKQKNDIENKKNTFFISLKNFSKKTFPLTYEILFQIKNYKLPTPRYRYVQSYGKSAWTYSEKFSGYDFREGIKKNIYYMEKLYKFLKSRNIKLSVAIYPWPNTLIYDNVFSSHVKIWKDFCLNKCHNFIDYFPIFFENKKSLNLKEAKNKIDKYYLKYDMHFNSVGHKKISEPLINLY